MNENDNAYVCVQHAIEKKNMCIGGPLKTSVIDKIWSMLVSGLGWFMLYFAQHKIPVHGDWNECLTMKYRILEKWQNAQVSSYLLMSSLY